MEGDHTLQEELDDELYDRIVALSEEGNKFYDDGLYREALAKFSAALELVPEPINDWETSTWLLASIGDCHYLLGEYGEARDALARAMYCPGALGNSFIHLRLGQVQYELGNEARAKDELARAYMGGGKELFDEQDPKYYAFIKKYMRGL